MRPRGHDGRRSEQATGSLSNFSAEEWKSAHLNVQQVTPMVVSPFPPYGLIPASWLDPTDPEIPPKPWDSSVDYVAWLEAVADLLAQVLWPRFDPSTGQWVGASSVNMVALTQIDFELFKSLRPKFKQPVWPSRPDTHQVFFEFEDTEDYFTDNGILAQDRSFDRSLRAYFQRDPYEPSHDAIANKYDTLFFQYQEGVDLHLKRRMQRPRALQTAWLLGRTDFSYERAGTAASPSMISGHCFESLVGGIASFVDARGHGASETALSTLGQHTVDIGDRRVFAGVHYPSDNISSWITTLAICPFLFAGNVEARDWAWKAISTQSTVFQAIGTVIENAGPYQQAWETLHHMGTCGLPEIRKILSL